MIYRTSSYLFIFPISCLHPSQLTSLSTTTTTKYCYDNKDYWPKRKLKKSLLISAELLTFLQNSNHSPTPIFFEQKWHSLHPPLRKLDPISLELCTKTSHTFFINFLKNKFETMWSCDHLLYLLLVCIN